MATATAQCFFFFINFFIFVVNVGDRIFVIILIIVILFGDDFSYISENRCGNRIQWNGLKGGNRRGVEDRWMLSL